MSSHVSWCGEWINTKVLLKHDKHVFAHIGLELKRKCPKTNELYNISCINVLTLRDLMPERRLVFVGDQSPVVSVSWYNCLNNRFIVLVCLYLDKPHLDSLERGLTAIWLTRVRLHIHSITNKPDLRGNKLLFILGKEKRDGRLSMRFTKIDPV